jgi:ABC-type lipoprotein export system ATPase subunit
MSAVLECRGIAKWYGSGELSERVLADVDLCFERGESSLLLGPSGSGKTTLLSILGCLLAPSRGQLTIDAEPVDFSRKAGLTEVRRQKLGFIFQHAQLLPFMTVEENLRVCGANAGLSADDLAGRLDALLERLGLARERHKHPAHLSGGQRQRVAIARALLHEPAIVLADEPTAALDWQHGRIVVELLLEQARSERAVLVVVTHDTRLVPLFDRILQIDDGRVTDSKS